MFGSETHLPLMNAPFLARLTRVYTPTSGAQAGINLYAFVEQTLDPATGIPADASPARQTSPPTGQPTAAYAIELNNTLLAVPGSTPPGFPNPGPYVSMRLKGVAGAAPVYEFAGPPPTVIYDQWTNAAVYNFGAANTWFNVGDQWILSPGVYILAISGVAALLAAGTASIQVRIADITNPAAPAVLMGPLTVATANTNGVAFDVQSMAAAQPGNTGNFTVALQAQLVTFGSYTSGSTYVTNMTGTRFSLVGSFPSAVQVNGLSGNVTIAPATGSGQSANGVGATVSTNAGQVSVGLTPAAAAALNASLAKGNW